MKYCKFFAVVCLAALLIGCADDQDPYSGLSEAQIFQKGQAALHKEYYADAVSAYEAQEAKYPYGEYAHQEQLNIIYAYYQNAEYPSALSASQRYIHLNPQGRFVDYAYYMQAMSAFAGERSFMENYFPVDPATRDLQPMQDAFGAFEYVVKNFPQSHYAADARLHMVYIRNLFARNDLKTAEYYMTRKAYVAALARAHNVVFKYPQAPSRKQALVIMYQCYQAMALTGDAAATQKVFAANYPGEDIATLKA
jgi:outer membrane protein assembly factor BamD